MKLVDRVSWGDGDFTPKLLGVYEEELHPCIAEMAEQKFGAVVIIGCAEGYYAVGCARLFHETPILAFDIDPVAITIMQEAAALNGVSELITTGGRCSGSELVADSIRFGRLLVICDCEGFELEIFKSEDTRTALRHSDLIIECHDFMDPVCTPLMIRNFSTTHVCEMISCASRNPNVFPFLAKFSDLDRWLAVNENRPCLMNWIIARSQEPRVK